MALTIETGAVVAGANSYVSVSDADTFFEDRYNTLWTETATDEAKEGALVRAADYLMQKYRMKWAGSRVEATQRMDWPRRGVPVPDFFDPFYRQTGVPLAFRDTYFIGPDEIPVEVKEAQMLLAAEILSSDGLTVGAAQEPLGRVTKREKVGSLEVEYFGDGEGGARLTELYWDAQQRIEPFIRPTSSHTGALIRS